MKQSLWWFCILFFLFIPPGLLSAQAIDSTGSDLDSMMVKPVIDSEEDQQPYWVREMKIEDPEACYFGIGMSKESRENADDKAQVEFSKMLRFTLNLRLAG
ncbi:MAG: hypothetical protein PWP06_1179 [Candidatus Marinimicrobia bacterium]|jgi:hypothetical protein|nr:hypothetical protein [Candidatus Neomarinimicrobiota bacterium]